MKRTMFFAFCLFFMQMVNAQIAMDEVPIGLRESSGTILKRQTTLWLSAPDMERITKEDAFNDNQPGALRFAYPISVNYTLGNSGEWEELEDGGRLWRLTVKLPDALSTNVSYDKFWLPKGGKFFVYSEGTKQYIGAITSEYIDGNIESPYAFSTGLIYGETYYYPKL